MLKHLVIVTDEYMIHVYADQDDCPASLLKEAASGKGQPLTGVYYFRKDAPHTNPGQQHVHVYKKRDQLFAINWDGTAHDQSHGVTIPAKVQNALQSRFPDLQVPKDRIIEAMDPLAMGVIVETINKTGMTVEEMVELQILLEEARKAS